MANSNENTKHEMSSDTQQTKHDNQGSDQVKQIDLSEIGIHSGYSLNPSSNSSSNSSSQYRKYTHYNKSHHSHHNNTHYNNTHYKTPYNNHHHRSSTNYSKDYSNKQGADFFSSRSSYPSTQYPATQSSYSNKPSTDFFSLRASHPATQCSHTNEPSTGHFSSHSSRSSKNYSKDYSKNKQSTDYFSARSSDVGKHTSTTSKEITINRVPHYGQSVGDDHRQNRARSYNASSRNTSSNTISPVENLTPEERKEIDLDDVAFYARTGKCVGCGVANAPYRAVTQEFICENCRQDIQFKLICKTTALKKYPHLTFADLINFFRSKQLRCFFVRNWYTAGAPSIKLYYEHEIQKINDIVQRSNSSSHRAPDRASECSPPRAHARSRSRSRSRRPSSRASSHSHSNRK